MKSYNEEVLVMPANQTYLLKQNNIEAINFQLMDRNIAELDVAYRQIIPYAYITDTLGNILVYRRTNTGGEKRLYDKLSIGFGGHINNMHIPETTVNSAASEFNFARCIELELRREITEEIDIAYSQLINVTKYTNNKTMYIEKDDTDVDRVHIGFVNHLFLPGSLRGHAVSAKEDTLVIDVKSITEVVRDSVMMSHMENWSRFILEQEYA